jgi:CIC family chloride channel protein
MIGAGFAVAAMGGLFSATVRAPLVGVVLVVELTGAFELTLELLVTCVTAHVVAQWLGGRPIYEVLLERSMRLAGRARSTTSEATSSPVGIDDAPRRDTTR